jgi:hypothetical protein
MIVTDIIKTVLNQTKDDLTTYNRGAGQWLIFAFSTDMVELWIITE